MLDKKLFNIDPGLTGFCKRNKIGIVNEDTFVLANRKSILDYYLLTGNYKGFLKDMFNGGLILNNEQLEEYQRKDFIRRNGVWGEKAEEAFLTYNPSF